MNMTRLYFLVTISILIICSHTVNAFFNGSIQNITTTRNLTCRLNEAGTVGSNFQLCAIRIYQGTGNGNAVTSSLYNGLRYVNIFRNFIQRKCSSWPKPNGVIADTGFEICTIRLEFETFTEVDLCICATDSCNRDRNSCFSSIQETNNNSPLMELMPDLNSTIQCTDTLNASNICAEHKFINVSRCQEYVNNNSVLCGITDNGSTRIQTSLIYENYEAYLDEKIYQALSLSQAQINISYVDSEDNVYYTYSNNNIVAVAECACADRSSCNENIEICSRQTVVPTETTALASSFTTQSLSTLFSASAVVTDTTPLWTDTFMTTAFTNSVTEITSVATTFTDSITISANPTTTITSGDSSVTFGGSSVTFGGSSVTSGGSSVTSGGSNTTFADSTAASLPQSTTVPSATPQQTYAAGETGLGSSATAGIACGIIFSAMVFSAEIVYFKFFHSGNIPSGSDRSVYYQA